MDPAQEHINQFEENAKDYITLLSDVVGDKVLKVYEHLLVCHAPGILKVSMYL